jgi:uncharacterized membrane protein HdeD (DUF308 family)
LASNDQKGQESHSKREEETDLSIEVVLLLILGVFMLLFGLLLFRIDTGATPYTPDSTYGLFLVIVSLQIITMGKTPFGDLRRSWIVIIIGICTSILGIYACFIPGHLTSLIHILVGVLLLFGGISLLLRLFISEEKAKMWMKVPGILQQLTIACASVYIISAILGLIVLFPGTATDLLTSVILVIYGIGFFYLSWCIQKVTRLYPPEEIRNPPREQSNTVEHPSRYNFKFLMDAALPLSIAIIIVIGVLLTLCGLLLFPVSLRIIPYSADGQLGLLLVITAIQMLALGQTPLGQFRRTWLLITIGIVFAAMGIFSCIVPGILTGVINILLGLFNIFSGSLFLMNRYLSKQDAGINLEAMPDYVISVAKKLGNTQIAQNIIGITFGISALVPGLVSLRITAGILVIFGLLFLILSNLLYKMESFERRASHTP